MKRITPLFLCILLLCSCASKVTMVNLSVEMQGALSHDIEDSEISRNTIIAENANAEEIKTDDAVYENVDTETGEVKTDVPESVQATDQAAEKNNVDPYYIIIV